MTQRTPLLSRTLRPTLTALAALAVTGLAAETAAATTEPAGAETDFARAVAAALAETGDGIVTSYEADRTGYDVEVRLSDGSDVDVDLDADFTVARVQPDTDTDDDDDDDGDDDDDDDQVSESTDLLRAYDVVVGVADGGTVVSIEIDDARGYDAEVELDDGGELEIHLDEAFDVVRTEGDDD
jgi:hypothetical protein